MPTRRGVDVRERGSQDVDLSQDDECVNTRWHQFIRVWYRGN